MTTAPSQTPSAATGLDDAPAPRITDAQLRRLVVATSVGNMLEFYDIIVYGYFALNLSKAFFPSQEPTTALLFTLGTFAVSFLIRPIGGLVLGTYADRHGRKASLMASIVLMTIGTLAVALTPAYATIGVAAPIIILAARLLQGFSAGGEFGSSTAFLVEHAPNRRGFIASWQFASQSFATLFASAFGVVLASTLTAAQLQDWGWRIPFLFGILVGPIGIYIRNNLEDAAPPPAAVRHVSPIREVFAKQKMRLVLAIGALAVSTAVNYLIVYMPTYAVKTLKLPPTVGFVAAFGAGIVLSILTPLAGLISDHVGRTRLMLVVSVLMLVTIYPGFLLLVSRPTPVTIVAVVFCLAILKGFYYGPLAALMSELFPAASRATGLGFSYNVGVTLFGGLGPITMAWLGGFVGALAPGYYLTAVCVLSIATLCTIRWRVGLP